MVQTEAFRILVIAMRMKDGFLLVEILIALAFFVIFVAAMCRLQVETIKTRDFATKRMLSLTIITNCIERLKSGKNIDLFEKNKDFSITIEHLEPKMVGMGDLRGPKLAKVTVSFTHFDNKTFSLSMIGSC